MDATEANSTNPLEGTNFVLNANNIVSNQELLSLQPEFNNNNLSKDEFWANYSTLAFLVKAIFIVVSTILAALFSICLFRFLFRKLHWRICPRRTTAQQSSNNTISNQQNLPSVAGEVENEDEFPPNFFGAFHIPIQAADNFLEYAMSLNPFLFGRPSPFLRAPYFIDGSCQHPPKYEDAIKLPAPMPPAAQRQARIISANMRSGGRRSVPPPPLYDGRFMAVFQQQQLQQNQCTTSTSNNINRNQCFVSREEDNEQPPAYTTTVPSTLALTMTRPNSNPSNSLHSQELLPIQNLFPSSLGVVSKEFPEFECNGKFRGSGGGRARFNSADASFVGISSQRPSSAQQHSEESKLQLDTRHRTMAQSTSSLASTVLTTVDIETARPQQHQQKSNEYGVEADVSRPQTQTFANFGSNNATICLIEREDEDEFGRENSNRALTTTPIFISEFVPKLQRRLSFSVPTTADQDTF